MITNDTSSSSVFGMTVALGLVGLSPFHSHPHTLPLIIPTSPMQSAHQVFRKYETYNINVHAVIVFAPPILLTLFTKHTVLPALLGNFATYLSTLVLSILVYRISPIHPLARYPGPIGCKISKFWMGCICIPGFQHQYIKSLHERYGDVVRIGTLPFTLFLFIERQCEHLSWVWRMTAVCVPMNHENAVVDYCQLYPEAEPSPPPSPSFAGAPSPRVRSDVFRGGF